MSQYFDEAKWRQAIKQPDWYLIISDDLKRVRDLMEERPAEREVIKEAYRGFFERAIAQNQIPFGGPNPDLDSERQPIDMVVIHHTSGRPGLTLARLNVIHLLNIYVPAYSKPTVPGEEYLKGQAIASNHFHDGRQVFYGYHWFVRMDGTYQRLLNDEELGWQCGNWPVNCRSVAICLDNDYVDLLPDDEILAKVAEIINLHYPQVTKDKIIGHREVNPKTICPGNTFLTEWKTQLLELLKL